MRNTARVLAVLLFVVGGVATSAWGQFYVCDYVAPENRLTVLTLSGDYRYFEDRYLNDAENLNVGRLALEGLAWVERPGWSYNLDASVQAVFQDGEIALGAGVEGDGSARKYLTEKVFAFGGIDTFGLGLLPDTGLTLNVLGGLGIGRFVNVTPLAQALQAAEALVELGTLAEVPSEDVLQRVAEAIGRERELGPAGVLEEIEAALGVQLDVAAVLALQDVLRSEATRFCGWDATVAVGYELVDPTGANNAVLRLRANYATALDAASQLLARARWQAALPYTGAYLLRATVSYDRTLSPTADLTATYAYSRLNLPELEAEQTHALNVGVSLALQANLSVLLQAQAGWGTGFEEPEWGFSVGFEYDLF